MANGPTRDAAPLLHDQQAAAPSDNTVDACEEQPTSSSITQAETPAASFWSWLRGRRPGAGAERLPASDEQADEELQQRGQAAPASITVVVEAPEEAAVSTSEASGSGRRQQDQASGSGSSSSSSLGEIEPRPSSPRSVRMPSRGPPTCLICLEEFTQEEFVNGAALRLDCNCRGDLALRHRDCVMKWVQVKGSNMCELCKAEIRNIPAPPPRPTEADLPQLDEAYFNDPSHIHDFMPSSQDLVFDCVRVTWVAMIVSILFFEMSLGAALWTGLLAGFAYSIMVRIMYRSHFHAMRRLAEQQAALRREQEGGGAPGGGPAPPPVAAAV